jgi:hypothetical protein
MDSSLSTLRSPLLGRDSCVINATCLCEFVDPRFSQPEVRLTRYRNLNFYYGKTPNLGIVDSEEQKIRQGFHGYDH